MENHGIVSARMIKSLWALFFLGLTTVQSSAASFIPNGSKTSTPFGHVAFCKTNPNECRAKKSAKPDLITAVRWATVQKINTSVNSAIKPISDQQSSGTADVWSASVKSGDCEDYALAKRRKLVSAGFKSANLRLAMARTPSGIAHLVLVMRTEKGDMVLDNLRSDIKPWNQTGYRFLKIQAFGNGSQWVSIAG